MARLTQFLTDQLCSRLQRKHIGHPQLVFRENDVSQRLPAQLQTHQAAKIILVRWQLRTGQSPALQPHTTQWARRVTVHRFQAEQFAFRPGPPAVKTNLVLRHVGAVERGLRQLLLPVAQKAGVAGNAA